MTPRNTAISYLLFTAIIHALTYILARDVMQGYMEAAGFTLVRIIGAGVLFWIAGFFSPKEKIDRKDVPRLILSGVLGASLNMFFFYKGLQLTTPISASVIMVNSPLLVLFLSALILKEKLELRKIIGILLGVVGAVLLIYVRRKNISTAVDPTWGNFYVLLNAFLYAVYLIIVKDLMDKYNPFTLIKWMYLVGFVCMLPLGWSEMIAVNWQTMPIDVLYKILFIIVFTTFLNYALTLKAMKVLRPTTLSVFIYLQPVLTTFFAVILGKDDLDWIKVGCALLIFGGVYLVSFKKQTLET